jgi:hypothetical protein
MPTQTAKPLDTFAALLHPAPTDWRAALALAVEPIVSAHLADSPEKTAYDAVLERLRGIDPQLMLEVEAEAGELRYQAIVAGALVGYALARTWPARLEDYAGWLQAAAAYAELERPIVFDSGIAPDPA